MAGNPAPAIGTAQPQPAALTLRGDRRPGTHAAQISQFGTRLPSKIIKSFSEQIGGSARGGDHC